MTQERAAPARPWYNLVVRSIALNGWTKTELSERSGVARTTIDNWEKNSRPPSARAVNAVADVLGVDRGEAHSLAGITPGDADDIPPGIIALIREHYPPEQQQQVIDALRAASAPPGEVRPEGERPNGHRPPGGRHAG